MTRQLWSIWGGQCLAALALLIALRLRSPNASEAVEAAYPPLAALAALTFFIMGADYWGRYYLFGLLWLVAAVAMALTPAWAPLQAAILTAFCSWQVAFVMRRLERSNTARSGPT